MKMMGNYFIVERLARQHLDEAQRESERDRIAKQALLGTDREPAQENLPTAGSGRRGRMIPDATGAREVPGL